MKPAHPLFNTWDEMRRRQTPNFFRLYLNPFVAQTCLCLTRYVQDTWNNKGPAAPEFQSFLANAFDEALSGAVKLARYWSNLQHRPRAGLVIDPGGRLGNFAGVTLENQARIDFVPDLVVVGPGALGSGETPWPGGDYGFVVLVPAEPRPPDRYARLQTALAALVQQQSPLIITCLSRATLANCSRGNHLFGTRFPPDIAVFDESFVGHHVPFGAFTAKKNLYDVWNKRGRTTFHSTTFQPNTVAALHFMKCLEADDPDFSASLATELAHVLEDKKYCKKLFGQLYSPSLARTIKALGLDTPEVKATGHYVLVNERPIFDGVAGIACSLRGHNPATYPEEIAGLDSFEDCPRAVAARLKELTGLGGLLPAVSGATAVENALKIGLIAQHPRNYVLAFQGGFGGKTLFALTGTAKPSYKTNLNPLYHRVVYVDPFSPSAIADLELALGQHPVGVVQVELIQAVGGVRAVPDQVIRYLDSQKDRWGYLLFVDEVQTGMFRTGPFTRSQALGIRPDLLTLGKGTSDMMFPFSLTLFSDSVRDKLNAHRPGFLEDVGRKYGYEFGYKTVFNSLTRLARIDFPDMVSRAGKMFAEQLGNELASCKLVRSVRVFGLLIAVELALEGWSRKWFRKQAPSLYLLNMLRDRSFPLLMGFCQYEPNILKLTPPLSITDEEISRVCRTITAVLKRPFYKLLPPLLGVFLNSLMRGRRKSPSIPRAKV
jgi:acetylornithine/succinyldiaminopimelate/putrescine aminotransferase